MDHGRLFSNGEMLPGAEAKYQGGVLADILKPVTPASLATYRGATRLDFSAVAGKAILSAKGPSVATHVDDKLILSGLKAVWNGEAPTTLGPVSLNATYALAEGLAGNVRLAHLNDKGHTDLYIDGATGRILVVMDTSRAAYAWVYYVFHTWNYPWLATHPIIHNTLVLLLLLAGFSFSLTSLIVAVKRLRLTSTPSENKMKDQLYIMQPGFFNGDLGPLYCGDSSPVEGVLSFFPELREKIDVHYIPFQRPRGPLVELLGEENQSIPVLILAEGSEIVDPTLEPHRAKGRRFFNDQSLIRRYLSSQFVLPMAG